MDEPTNVPTDTNSNQAVTESTPSVPSVVDTEPSVPGVAVPMDQDPPQDAVSNNTTDNNQLQQQVPSAPVVETSNTNTNVVPPPPTPPTTTTSESDARPSSSSVVDVPSTGTPADVPSTEPSTSRKGILKESESSVQQNNEPATKPATEQPSKLKLDLGSLPTRQYLDQTVVPILLQGLSWLAKTRPDDPVTELSKYLLEHKSEYDWNFSQSASGSVPSSALTGEASAAVNGSSQSK